MSKGSVTEADIRLPQFRDSKIEDLEFDGSGEVVRKDRFETSMRRLQGRLSGINGLSPRERWTCPQVVGAVEKLQRILKLYRALGSVPGRADHYHPDNDWFVKNIDQDQLAYARSEPKEGHLIDHEDFSEDRTLIDYEYFSEDRTWEKNSAGIEYMDRLISISDMRSEIAEFWSAIDGK